MAARDRRCRPATLETLIDLGVTLHDPRARADRGVRGARRRRTGRRSIATRSTRAAATCWRHRDGSGRTIAHRRVRRAAVARGRVRRDGQPRREPAGRGRRRRPSARSVDGPRLVLCASDGELWGHHKKFADLTLAFATRVEARAARDRGDQPGRLPGAPPADLGGAARRRARRRGDRLELRRTGSGAGSATAAATWAARRRAGTRPGAGRCAGRWTSCATRRRAFYEDAAGDLFRDPWGARDAYGAVVDEPPPVRDRALAAFAPPRWTRAARRRGSRRAGCWSCSARRC